MMRRWSGLILLLGAAVAFGGRLSFEEQAAVQESLSRVHPRMRASWLKERGIHDPYYARASAPMPDSSELREVGRWSYGPSYDVDGRTTPSETLVALARGSGVSLLRFSRLDSLKIELLSDINAEGLMCRVKVADTLLYVGSRAGLEVWNIADEQSPVRLSWTPLPLNDFALQDSLVYTMSGDDSFRIYNVSTPASPVFRGACRDSGYLVSVSGNSAFLGDRLGLYVVDVGDPAAPHRVGAWGSAVEGVTARERLCYVTAFNPNQPGEITFHVIDVTVPGSPAQIGSLDSAGGFDVHLIDTLAFCSGDQYDEFSVVSVADSAHPRLVGTGNAPGANWGVWASAIGKAAFVAGRSEGLSVFDIANPVAPVRDTIVLAMDRTEDVSVRAGLAGVAGYASGLLLLNVQNPSEPFYLGRYDTLGDLPSMETAVLADSFAYVSWPVERLQSVDISDPTRPVRAGVCQDMFNPPQDMAVRDSFVFSAEPRRFQIVNVARPRQPVLMGTCVLPGESRGVSLLDTLAFVYSGPTQVIDFADPSSPVVVGEFDRGGYSTVIRDTFAYMTGYYAAYVYSIADPAAPRLVDSVSVGQPVNDIALADSLAYFGCQDGLRLMSLAEPAHPVVIGFAATPYLVWRTTYYPPYLYAACSEAGICVFETTQTSVVEQGTSPRRSRDFAAFPNPTCGPLRLVNLGQTDASAVVRVRDVTGRLVLAEAAVAKGKSVALDLTPLPPGVYFVGLRANAAEATVRVCKR